MTKSVNHLSPFDKRVVIITGAGKGLGRAYALYLARLGAHIIVNNRRHCNEAFASADRTVEEIIDLGGSAVAEYSDVNDPNAGASLLNCALASYQRLDAVIANAGVTEGKTFHKQTWQEFQQTITSNVLGTSNILHATFKHLYQQQHGAIVLSTSAAGLYGEHGLPAYSCAKAALLGLMYSLSLEGATKNLRINAIAPFATTRMTQATMPTALQQPLHPQYVAPIAAWLCSETCSITGEIVITGAGKISRAHIMESQSMQLPIDSDNLPKMNHQQWQKLASQSLNTTHHSAVSHFHSFIAGIKPQRN